VRRPEALSVLVPDLVPHDEANVPVGGVRDGEAAPTRAGQDEADDAVVVPGHLDELGEHLLRVHGATIDA
jgi:hypothetical protein